MLLLYSFPPHTKSFSSFRFKVQVLITSHFRVYPFSPPPLFLSPSLPLHLHLSPLSLSSPGRSAFGAAPLDNNTPLRTSSPPPALSLNQEAQGVDDRKRQLKYQYRKNILARYKTKEGSRTKTMPIYQNNFA